MQGLAQCEWFLIALSPAVMESDWVKDELFWAIDNRKEKIIPVLIEECDPGEMHIRMRRLQVIDLTQNYRKGFEDIISLVNR